MNRYRDFFGKLHRKHKKKAWCLGMGALVVLASVLLLGSGVNAETTVSASGSIKPNEASDILTTLSNVEYSHEFKVSFTDTSGNIEKEYPHTGSDTQDSILVKMGTYNSIQKFTPTILDLKLNTTGTDNSNQDKNKITSKTYYRIVDGGDSSTDGTSLQEQLKMYYEACKTKNNTSGEKEPFSGSVMLVNAGSGSYLSGFLDDFAKEYGLNEYSSETGIPLTRDGKAVKQIEMLTVSVITVQLADSDTSGTTYSLEGILSTKHEYMFDYSDGTASEPPQLKVPDVSGLSGADLTSHVLLPDDKIVLSSENENGTCIYQYMLSEEGEWDEAVIPWTEYTEPFPLNSDLYSSDSGLYLYIRSYPVEGEKGSTYERSEMRKVFLTYAAKADSAWGYPDVMGIEPDSGSELIQTASIKPPNNPDGTQILYIIVDQDDTPSIQTVWEAEWSALGLDEETASGTPALKTVGSDTYLSVNGRWYRCVCGTEGAVWKLSEDTGATISKTDLRGSGGNLNRVYVMPLKEGYTLKDEFWMYYWSVKLTAPTKGMITTQSGASIDGALSEEEKIVLQGSQTGGTLQYALTNSFAKPGEAAWKDYSTAFSVDPENTHLHVRWHAQDSSGYQNSEILSIQLTLLEESSGAAVTASPASGTTVDVGDTVTLKAGDDASGAVTWLYTFSDRTPVLTRLTAAQRERLGLDNKVSGDTIRTTAIDGTTYLKFNDVWYQSSDAGITVTTEKELRVTVDESIRQDTMLGLYALVLESGKELGNFTSFRYYYGITGQTADPTSTVSTSADAPAEVNMGDPLGLECSTPGSRIFYTTNGSVPSIDASGSDLRPTGSTKEYKSGDVIVVSEDFATYGRTFTITALAVTYTQYNGGVYRVYNDSEVVRFTYQVSDQAVVEGVSSIPATTAANPTEVEAGSSVQLYCGTEGVRIYYTVDGSEPVFDEDTGQMGANTYLYTTGVTVPEADGNTMFTITAVAYKEGLATSALSRLVFQYPSAVSMPYAVPAAGSVTENTEVALRCSTEGAVIYYEIAYGNSVPEDPTEESNVFDSSNPFRITKKTTIKAYAVSKGMESAVATFVYEVSDKLSTPTPSVETGTTVPSGTRLTLDADSGATVYYTLDGSDPKDPENNKVLIGTNVLLSGDAGSMVVLRTYAARTGYSDSEVGTYSYNISSYSGGIYADIESGSTVKNGDVIHLNTDVSDAVIYYTTDGSSPTENSASGNAVTINGDPGENVIVMAIAVADGTERSITSATFTYTIMDRLAAPSASVPDGAVFTEEGQVALTAETGKIYYTTDGTDPSTSSTLYRDPIVIDGSVQIKAIAVAEDYEQSSISSFSYGFADQVEAPTASYASGELEMGTAVTFASATEGATIYYRTDGVEPDTDDLQNLQVYTGPVTVNKATNFKVIAVKDKMRDSRVLSVGYTVREPEAPKVESAEETQLVTSASGRLQSRRNFADTQSGPSFTDVVLRNAVFGAVISAEEGSLPENVQLQVERTQVTETTETMVRQMLSENYGIVASYDVKLLEDGEEIQPSGEIEIGLPIPAEYENSLIRVVHVQEDGSVEVFETRRSGGVAYVMTDHLSVYAIAAPVEFQEGQKAFSWTAVVYTAAVALAGAGIFLIYRSKKMKREGRGQDE